MNPHRFDAYTSCLSAAGSRRRVLTALFASPLLAESAVPEAVVGCKRGKGRCKKKRRKECGDSKPCPPETPCCINGKCHPLCGATCCDECFAEILLTGQPDLDHPVCCPTSGGSVCSPNVKPRKKRKKRRKNRKKDNPADDLCCYPNQVCLNGDCCCDGCEGAVICGGRCCPSAACCNGACCEDGEVCANTPAGPACVPGNRLCGECFAGEVCHGGLCCAGNRLCDNGIGSEFCCAADEYCQFPGTLIAACCPFNTSCGSTYRGRRVRV